MADSKERVERSRFLEHIIERIDITDSQFDEARERYEAVGSWLGGPGSSFAGRKTDIKPQGSFRLGTVVRPWGRDDEFDLDLTFKVTFGKHEITQQKLKAAVGDRLRMHEKYAQMLDKEKNRCWRLNYAESTKFHMDIVPAIPDEKWPFVLAGVPEPLAVHASLITDKRDWPKGGDWPKSNPEGFALWFIERMKKTFETQRELLKKSMKVEQVPDFMIKTPLQRSIQLLKRHRDSMQIDDDLKPASIIISTLAAWAYSEEENLIDALERILAGMDDPSLIRMQSGLYVIANPVNPAENFADAWNKKPEKQKSFFRWLQSAQTFFRQFIDQQGVPSMAKSLGPVFGEKYVSEGILKLADSDKKMREAGTMRMAFGTGILGTGGDAKVRNHEFYGEDE